MLNQLRNYAYLILLLIYIFLVPQASLAVTYYVDGASLGGSCNDSGAGTSLSTAWCTIQKAATTAVAGDTVYIRGGTYRETATPTNSGTSGSPISFINYQNETPIINGADRPATWVSLGDQESGGLLTSGFESGDMSEYTSTTTEAGNTVSAQSSVINHGQYAMQGTYGGTNRNARANVNFTGSNDAYVRVYFRLNATYDLTTNDSGQVILNLRQGSTTNLAQVLLLRNSSGQFYLQARTNNPSTNTFYSGTAGEVVRDTWYSIELRYKGNDGSTGGAEFWLNNVSKGSIYSLNTNTFQPSRIEIGGSTSGPGTPTNGSILYMDDAKVDTARIGNFVPAGNAAIYKATGVNWTVRMVFEDGTRLSSVATLGDLTSAGKWYIDTGANILYVWSSDSANPASHLTEAARRNFGFDLTSLDYITISGLTFKYHNNTSFGSIHLIDSDGVIITQSILTDNLGSGIFANHSTNNTFSYNQILRNYRLFGAGIRLENGSNNNSINENTITGLGLSGGNGIFFCGDITCNSTGNSTNLIARNTISNVYDSCMYLDSNNDSNTIERNICHDSYRENSSSGGNGIHLSLGSDSNIVKNNLVYNTQRHGISSRDGNTGNQILYNTIYNTGFGSSSFGESGNGINIQGINTNIIVKNNIVHTAKTAAVNIDPEATATTTSDYNLVYNPGNPVMKFNGTTYSIISDYYIVSGQDNHSRHEDPKFTNIGGADFSLKDGSGAIDNAITLAGVTNDIRGTARPQGCNPDIGAFEKSTTCSPTSSSSESTVATRIYPPACNDTTPGMVDLYGALAENDHEVMLYFTEAKGNYDHYAIEYGVESGKYIYGAERIGTKGTRTYLVQALKPNTTYYFRIRGDYGCARGPWSAEISGRTGSVSNTGTTLKEEGTVKLLPSLAPPPAPKTETTSTLSASDANKKNKITEDKIVTLSPSPTGTTSQGTGSRNLIYIFPILFIVSLFLYMKFKK